MGFRVWLFALPFALGLALTTHAQGTKKGYLIDVPVPLTNNGANDLLARLERLAEAAPAGGRTEVVLRYSEDASGGEATAFEDALKVARAISGETLRSLRIVSFVQGRVSGHSVLPILASDALLLSQGGVLADASAGEPNADDTISLLYESVAARRGLFPAPVVRGLVNPDIELAWVTKVDGAKVFASGPELVKLRETGGTLSEQVWSGPGTAASINADQLRSARIAAGIVQSSQEAAEVLDLAELIEPDSSGVGGDPNGILLEVAGAVSRSRVRRWQSNLNGSLSDKSINTWVITFDSNGGDLDQSATLASLFANPQPPLRNVVGLVREEARSDAALLAVSCKPLYMKPEAVLGGSGSDQISLNDLENHAELLQSIAEATKRPVGLIRGLLCTELEVYRYTNKKTGRVKYSTEDDLVLGVEDPNLERDRWEKGDRVELAEGVTAQRAIELGLAEGTADSLDDLSNRIGMTSPPKLVSDRGLVRFVERMGRSRGLMMILLMVGFISLSAEMNAPGMGVPGFLAMVCFGLFFWMNYLAGTAEWLELVLLILGLGCIAMEVLVIPGFGVFGIGGLIMTIASIVLMSQTFVLPQNSYQLTVITKGLWVALGSLLGLFGGFFLMRQLFPHLPLFRHLIMETPDLAALDASEKLVDYSHLMNQTGTATTPLRPSGKARFGDEIVQVVSDGGVIDKGMPVLVIDVQGGKVVVEG